MLPTRRRSQHILGSVSSVAFSPDGSTFASSSRDGRVILWDAANFEQRATITGHTAGFSSIAFSPDSRRLVSGSWDRTVRLWDTITGNNSITLTGHIGPIESVAFSPDGRTVASSGGITVINGWFVDDYTVRLWDAATGTHKTTLIGHKDGVYSVAFRSRWSAHLRVVAGAGTKRCVCGRSCHR